MKRKFILVLVACFLCTILPAQKIDVKKLKGMKVRSIGPAGMSGRVTSIDVVNSDPSIIYVGTASGGLWKSESGGIRWKPIFDKQPVQSIGAVAVCQGNPDVIWAGTGEGNPRNSHTSGAGIYKSIDGGKSWELKGLKKTKTIHRIIINKDNPDIVYAACLGSAWGPNTERGVYRTKDGGKTWKKILYNNDQTGAADLVVDPSNPNKLIAAMWEYNRKPWFFTSGGKGSGLYVTFDGGDTWKQRTDKEGLPKGELGRIGLAIAPSMPKVVYALVEAEKLTLYRSNDGGFNFHKVSDKKVGNRPFYYADIYVDPQNENRIYNLWSYTSLSTDGGKTFKNILDYRKGVHPDHHAFWIHPDDPKYIIDGNDGGLNISRDRGENWRFVENLPLGQFYHINIDNDFPYHIYGGMQDNGSWRGPAYVWQSGGIRNSHWQELLFGDGFDVVPNRKDSRFGYAMYQGGSLHTYDLVTGRTQYIQPVNPGGDELRFNWNAAIAQDPFNDCGLYFGSQFVHYSSDCGQSWKMISPDLTTNDTTKQKQAKSGGLTIDATRAENFTTIIAIAPSPKNKNVIWVGTDDGNLQLTKDGGKTWVNLIGKLKGVPAGSWVPQIEVSQHKEGEAYVVINNYRRNDWNPYVYKTKDFGNTWVRIVNQNKVSGHALCIVQDPVEAKLLFLGTENGMYFSIDGGSIWNKWKDDYPSVSTMDMKIQSREGDLVIGTFGRAVFVLDDIGPIRELAKNGASLLNRDFYVFKPPVAVLVNNKAVHDVRFTADAHYKGRNRGSSGRISFYIKEIKEEEKDDDKEKKEKKEDEKDEKKKDKVKIQVIDSSGDTIRTYTVKPDTGLNRIGWNLKRDGVRFSSWKEPKDDEDMPSGRKVLPGTYQLLFSYGDNSASTKIKVISDPRETEDLEGLKAKAEMHKDLSKYIEATTEAFNRLKEVKKTVALVNKQMENIEDSLKKDLQKLGKTITKKTDSLMGLYMKAENFVGYDHITVLLMDHLWTAQDYIMSGKGAPSATAVSYFERAKGETNKVLLAVNDFIEKEWKEYRVKIEETKLNVFKDYKSIEVDGE